MQKTIAAQINLHVNDPTFRPVWSGTYCTCWVAVWVVIAVALGLYHKALEKSDLTIGKDGIGLWPCLQPSKLQDGEFSHPAPPYAIERPGDVSIQRTDVRGDEGLSERV